MIYIDEFLFRGTPGGETPLKWHVILSEAGVDTFGKPFRHDHIFNVAQAEAAGFSLKKVLGDLNTETLKECEALREKVQVLENQLSEPIEKQITELEQLRAEFKTLQSERDTLKTSLAAAVARTNAVHARSLWQRVKAIINP